MYFGALLVHNALASTLSIQGSDPKMVMGRSWMRMGCDDDDGPSFQMVSPKAIEVGESVTLYVHGVSPSCASLSLTQPCAAGNDIHWMPLFYCRFSTDGAVLQRSGPVYANRTADSSFGHQVWVRCPALSRDNLPFGPTPLDITVSLAHFAPTTASMSFDNSSTAIPFRGIFGGDVVKLDLPKGYADCLEVRKDCPTCADGPYTLTIGSNWVKVWCAFPTMSKDAAWTLVSRIVETSVKHMVPEAYGTLESVDQPKPWKLSDADINRLAAMSSLANPYRFDCDAVNTGAGVSSRSLPNLDAQYFSSDCTFVAYASVGSGACHDYYISAINTQTASSSNDCTPLQPMIEPRTHSSRAPGTQ